MSNPFEDESRGYLVLRNGEGQYSLWPEAIAVPEGWTAEFGPEQRASCITYIETHWTDMRPASLARQMDSARV